MHSTDHQTRTTVPTNGHEHEGTTLSDAYRALVATLPAEHVQLVADVLRALQGATLTEVESLAADAAALQAG